MKSYYCSTHDSFVLTHRGALKINHRRTWCEFTLHGGFSSIIHSKLIGLTENKYFVKIGVYKCEFDDDSKFCKFSEIR